jgi:hypothetical protein
MTQKHYIEVAAMLNQQRMDTEGHPGQYHRVREITRELALIMKSDNPRFKAGKFFTAAGFPELTGTAQGLN